MAKTPREILKDQEDKGIVHKTRTTDGPRVPDAQITDMPEEERFRALRRKARLDARREEES